ncbi:quinone oxidoreductase [Kitasatospora sp. NBC_00374]|uniref:quinone oxidoreductase family protein n=1 Tax=Kitasatospora sp. NBC_00374 TaxID=2975964 RepID=UPI0030DF52BE
MRATLVEQPGGPEVLVAREVATPAPGPGEILVRHEAVGVNFIDVYYRDGTYPAPLPLVPGQEAAGTVVEAGPGAGFATGDRVAYATALGAYAEYAVLPAAKAVPVPPEVSSRAAAAVLLQGLAAHYLSHTTHPIGAGDTVLVHAGAGGLGGLLVQFAAARGATVLATASTEAKRETAREHGADFVLPYLEPERMRRQIEELTGGGATVVYDSVGADTFESSLHALAPRGLLVLCGLSSGKVPPFDLERLRALGSLKVTRPSLADHVRDRQALTDSAAAVLAHLADGRLRPRIHAELPLDEAAKAHELLESRATTGKLLLLS